MPFMPRINDPIIRHALNSRDKIFRKEQARFEQLSSVVQPLTERELSYYLFRQEYKEIREYGIKNADGREVRCFHKRGKNEHYIIVTDTGESAFVQLERAEGIAGRIFEQRQAERKQEEQRKTKREVKDERIDLIGGGNIQESPEDTIEDLKYFVLAVCFAETDARVKEIFDSYLPFGATYLYDRGSSNMRPLIYDKKNGRFIFNNYFRRTVYSRYNKIRKVIINNIIGKHRVKEGLIDYKSAY